MCYWSSNGSGWVWMMYVLSNVLMKAFGTPLEANKGALVCGLVGQHNELDLSWESQIFQAIVLAWLACICIHMCECGVCRVCLYVHV